MSGSVVVLELNELCPPLLDRFIAAGDLPELARLRSESTVWVTEAEEAVEHLNPWVQWVTAHTGASFDDHGVLKLGDGAALTLPTVADVVSGAGFPVWLCGPMNVVPTSELRGRWLPDPWNPDPGAVEPSLQPFAAFVRANVQEHTNEQNRLGAAAYGQFLRFMLGHGVSAGAVRATVGQLVGERLRRAPRWKRVALLDRFQWDLFAHELARLRPRFATYFSNTTAHYQHLYWRYMDPDAFSLRPTPEEIDQMGGAIRYGYQEMDRLVGQARALVGDDHTLVLCTALSQQPYVERDDHGGSRFYRPHSIERFVAALGLADVRGVAPVMAEQFHVLFSDESAAQRAAGVLREATVAGRPAFDVRQVGADVFTGFAPKEDLPADSSLDVPQTGARLPLASWLYRSETARSGHHHPQGAFWVRPPGGGEGRDGGVIPLRSVAPTLLSLMELEPPPSMAIPSAPTR